MLRRLFVTFVLVLVLGLLAFYGVSYFTREEEPLREIPFSQGTSLFSSPSSESTSPQTTREATRSFAGGEKTTETSGGVTSSENRSAVPDVPPSPQGTETVTGTSSSTSSANVREARSSADRETSVTTGTSRPSEGRALTSEPSEETSTVPSSAAKPFDSGRSNRVEESTSVTRKRSRTSSMDLESSVATGRRVPTGDEYVVRVKNPIFEKQLPNIRRSLDQMNIPVVVTSSRENIRLNVIYIGYFRTEGEARSVAPLIARTAGLSDYIVTRVPHGVYYTMQVGAYYNKSEADRIVERLMRQRFPVRLETKTVPTKVYYIKTREISNRQQALRIQDRLRELDLATEIVRS